MEEGGGRLQALFFAAVVRPLLFVFWSLVLWGTFVAAALLWTALTGGPAAAMAAILNRELSPALGGANLGLAVLAVAVWVVVVVLARRGGRDGRRSPRDRA